METLGSIQNKIGRLAKTGETVHIRVSLNRPKVRLEDVAVRVVGAYANIFRIEVLGCTPPRFYSLQYTDVLIGQIAFAEEPSGS